MSNQKTSGTQPKNQIYFSRTYRHLTISLLESALFLLLLIVPCMVLLLFYYDELTLLMCQITGRVLQEATGVTPQLAQDFFLPHFGPTYSLVFPSNLPSYSAILLNLGLSLALIWLLSTGRRKGNPVSVYLMIVTIIHVMACVFFLLGRDSFSYTIRDYSDLYMKQELGIWFTFLLLMGLIMGLLSRGGLLRRILTVAITMAYAFLFGLTRYILFLFILQEASVLYMPLMFFAFGPFFDFMYFVAIYAISTNGMIQLYESKLKGEWKWA